MIAHRTFHSELGRPVKLRVYDTTAGDVMVEMSDPNSSVEHLYSGHEARMLLHALQEVIGRQPLPEFSGVDENAFIDTLEPAKGDER